VPLRPVTDRLCVHTAQAVHEESAGSAAAAPYTPGVDARVVDLDGTRRKYLILGLNAFLTGFKSREKFSLLEPFAREVLSIKKNMRNYICA